MQKKRCPVHEPISDSAGYWKCNCEPKPKDSEVWCEHMNNCKEIIFKQKNPDGITDKQFESKFCPICGTPRPTPKKLELWEKYKAWGQEKHWQDSDDFYKRMALISEQHFSQEAK